MKHMNGIRDRTALVLLIERISGMRGMSGLLVFLEFPVLEFLDLVIRHPFHTTISRTPRHWKFPSTIAPSDHTKVVSECGWRLQCH